VSTPESNGEGDYRTFAGAGFGTLMVQLQSGARETPPVASSRAYLRGGLPAMYQDGDFGMRFVGALEAVLDPIVAVIDALPAYFNPDHAPRDVLNLLAAWLGVEVDESQPLPERRRLVRESAELSRRRGTVRGMELALHLSFPKLPLRVEDNGGVSWGDQPQRESSAGSFVVYCDKPIPETTQAAVARTIEQYKPVHCTYRLRVKAAKKSGDPS
jgi:phage tail-like protein